jgi:hypothetical protein
MNQKPKSIPFQPSIANLYVLQWSHSKKQFNILQFRNAAERSIQAFLEGYRSDWITLYIGTTQDEVQKVRQELEREKQMYSNKLKKRARAEQIVDDIPYDVLVGYVRGDDM